MNATEGTEWGRMGRWCWFVEKNKMVTLGLSYLAIYGKCGNNSPVQRGVGDKKLFARIKDQNCQVRPRLRVDFLEFMHMC